MVLINTQNPWLQVKVRTYWHLFLLAELFLHHNGEGPCHNFSWDCVKPPIHPLNSLDRNLLQNPGSQFTSFQQDTEALDLQGLNNNQFQFIFICRFKDKTDSANFSKQKPGRFRGRFLLFAETGSQAYTVTLLWNTSIVWILLIVTEH